jgi:broad specificity phosphatase PhoE
MGPVLTTILLARHGETDDNVRQVFQGRAGGGLNERGRMQSERLAFRLAKRGVSAIVSSDLDRAKETALIVAHVTGLAPTFDSDLREVDVGEWTGLSHREVQERYPEEWDAWNNGLDVRRGGGETYEELAERIQGSIERIAHAHMGKTVLVVSHGAALRSYVCRSLGLAAQGPRSLGGMENTALALFTIVDGRMRLRGWNDTAHLEGM